MATYSHSRLETYRSCPYKYKLQYIDRIPDEAESVEAFMGKRVHEALERLYRFVRKSHPVDLDDVLAGYEESWDKNWHEGVGVVQSEFTPDDYRETGRRCIRDYWRRYEPFDQAVVIDTERRVKVALDDAGRFELIGYMDRLDRVADGVYEIHDYKTGGSLPDQASADADPQLGIYQLAVQAMWPDVREVALVWHYLAFDHEIRSSRAPEALEQLRADTIAAIEQIEAETRFEAVESRLCDWCGYQHLCPRRKHAVTTAELEAPAFAAEDGVRLVNEFVELSERKSELEARIDELKEALVAYAKANGVEVIVGSDHRVTVKVLESLAVPKKGSEERALLEAKIRELGKWEELSALDARALTEAIGSGRWDEETCSALAEFLARSETHRISRAQLREER